MFKYKVKIRKSFGELSESARLIEGGEYFFKSGRHIQGGHADGEVMMVPQDDNYPSGGPEFLALGDLELIEEF